MVSIQEQQIYEQNQQEKSISLRIQQGQKGSESLIDLFYQCQKHVRYPDTIVFQFVMLKGKQKVPFSNLFKEYENQINEILIVCSREFHTKKIEFHFSLYQVHPDIFSSLVEMLNWHDYDQILFNLNDLLIEFKRDQATQSPQITVSDSHEQTSDLNFQCLLRFFQQFEGPIQKVFINIQGKNGSKYKIQEKYIYELLDLLSKKNIKIENYTVRSNIMIERYSNGLYKLTAMTQEFIKIPPLIFSEIQISTSNTNNAESDAQSQIIFKSVKSYMDLQPTLYMQFESSSQEKYNESKEQKEKNQLHNKYPKDIYLNFVVNSNTINFAIHKQQGLAVIESSAQQ